MFQEGGHSPPCITAAERKRDSAQHQARRGGRAIKKISRSSADREAGVVFRWMQKENHPGCVRFGRCATLFLMTQPPLLAVMQGGEWLFPSIAAGYAVFSLLDSPT